MLNHLILGTKIGRRKTKTEEKNGKKGVGYDMPFCADVFYNASASQLFFGRGAFCKGWISRK